MENDKFCDARADEGIYNRETTPLLDYNSIILIIVQEKWKTLYYNIISRPLAMCIIICIIPFISLQLRST